MATRYVWLGYGAALLNSQVYNRIPKGFSRVPDEKGPPFRKIFDPSWKPVVSLVTLDDPLEYTPIPTISQHRIVEMVKVTNYVDSFRRPLPEEPKHWFKRLVNAVLPETFIDYVVFVTTDVDPLKPFIIYYRSRWVDD